MVSVVNKCSSPSDSVRSVRTETGRRRVRSGISNSRSSDGSGQVVMTVDLRGGVPYSNPDVSIGDGGLDRKWTYVVEVRTPDRVDLLESVTVFVTCGEPWVSQ